MLVTFTTQQLFFPQENKIRTKLEIKLKIEFVCSVVELDAWEKGKMDWDTETRSLSLS